MRIALAVFIPLIAALVQGGVAGDVATASALVNAVPVALRAPAGILRD